MFSPKAKFPSCERGNWISPEEIDLFIKRHRRWVLKRLPRDGEISVSMEHVHGGRPTIFYPPCIIFALRLEAEHIPTAHGWLTRRDIEVRLGVTWRIANKLLEQFADRCEIRRDKGGRRRIHYPPSVLHAIKAHA